MSVIRNSIYAIPGAALFTLVFKNHMYAYGKKRKETPKQEPK